MADKSLEKIFYRFNQIWSKYVPYFGVFGYLTLSTNALHLPVVQQLLTKADSRVFVNSCFALSHFGTTTYIYHRPSFSLIPCRERLLYSAFGSTLFNLGSVLSWSILQIGLPEDEIGKSLVGVACSSAYLYIGYKYLKCVDDIIFRVFKAGEKKLANDQCNEVKERLERSHHDYEDQEIEIHLDGEIWGANGSDIKEEQILHVNSANSF